VRIRSVTAPADGAEPDRKRDSDRAADLAVYDDALDTGYVYRVADDDASAASWEDGRVAIDGTEHEPAALPYEREVAFDAMWFAWYGYYPMTDLYE